MFQTALLLSSNQQKFLRVQALTCDCLHCLFSIFDTTVISQDFQCSAKNRLAWWQNCGSKTEQSTFIWWCKTIAHWHWFVSTCGCTNPCQNCFNKNFHKFLCILVMIDKFILLNWHMKSQFALLVALHWSCPAKASWCLNLEVLLNRLIFIYAILEFSSLSLSASSKTIIRISEWSCLANWKTQKKFWSNFSRTASLPNWQVHPSDMMLSFVSTEFDVHVSLTWLKNESAPKFKILGTLSICTMGFFWGRR